MALQRLGPFELLRVVGRGGMGTVYRAREAGDDHLVAVKALAPAYSFDEHFRNRFEAEIDALMSLDHENIVRLLSYGQDEGNLYFAMELVDGTSLFEEQKKGQVFHWQEILDIGIQVCEGLRHAHDRGIVHRDLKPGNLMITSSRQVKITDFGIAKSFGSSSLTNEGNVLGTMDFMAPEQARGSSTNSRSDLFSLGAVLYALLAGRPPFLRKTIEGTFEALLSETAPDQLDKVAPDTPKPLAQLIHRLLEKDPANRVATAQATSRQLAHVRDQVKNTPNRDTQVVGARPADFDSVNTHVVASNATDQREFGDTSERREQQYQLTSEEPRSGSGSSSETDEMQAVKPDYFNEVTPQQRQKKADLIEPEESQGSIWPLLLALILVVGVGAGGVWYKVFRNPSQEELLAIIDQSLENPVRVQDEIRQLISLYPESEEAPRVMELNDRVEVTKYAKTIRARKVVSDAEAKFLKIYEAASNHRFPNALEKADSYLLFYSDSQGLTAAESRAVEMARRIRPYWARKAGGEIEAGRSRIKDAIQQARESGSEADALAKLKSIIDIYEEDAWAAELVETARQEYNNRLAAIDPDASKNDQE